MVEEAGSPLSSFINVLSKFILASLFIFSKFQIGIYDSMRVILI